MSALSIEGIDHRLLTQEVVVVTEVLSKLGPGEITMTMTIGPSSWDSRCLRNVSANFEHRLLTNNSIPGPAKNLGYISGSIIDRTVTAEYPIPESEQRKGKNDAKMTVTDLAWKRDLLAIEPASPMSDDEDENERSTRDWLGGRAINPFRLDALFDSDGRPKESEAFSARALRRKRLLIIDWIVLNREFRHIGLGSPVLRLFLDTLSNLPSPDCFRGPCYLMPGEVDTDFGHTVNVNREENVRRFRRHWERLLGFYEREGFETWDVVGWDKEDELLKDIRVLGKVVW